jgi:hypothetical protein
VRADHLAAEQFSGSRVNYGVDTRDRSMDKEVTAMAQQQEGLDRPAVEGMDEGFQVDELALPSGKRGSVSWASGRA